MPNSYNPKNYFAHGGNELVIGGKVTFLPGATIEGCDDLTGTTNQIPHQADSTAATIAALKEDFNCLLTKLRDSGFMLPAEDGDSP